MLNMMNNENTSFASILIPFLKLCSVHSIEHESRKGIEILGKLVFSFSIIAFTMKLLVILFIIKLHKGLTAISLRTIT